jgi:hypothetical protein
MDMIKLNAKLHSRFLRRLKNNHLEECADQKKLSDYEVLRYRKIYEWYQGLLVKNHIVAGY